MQASRPPSRVSQALAANRLGVWTVVAIVGGAIAPLTVVAGGATTGWAVAGVVAIPLAYLVIAVLLILFSTGYTAMSRGSISAGPLYTFPAKGLGRPAGVGSGAIALFAYSTMGAGLLGGFGAVAKPLLAEQLGWSAPWWAWALAAWAIIAILGVLHVDVVGKVLAVLLGAEVLVTVILAVVMFAHPANGHASYTAISPGQILVAGFGAACAIAIAGFVGFEATGNLSEESKDPRRTVPLATYLALGIVGLVYGGTALAMVVAAGTDNIVAKSTSDGTDTMFNLAAPYVPSWLITAGHFLLLSSLFASALAFQSVSSRYLFTLGREGVLPRRLAQTGARNHAPIAASMTQSVIGLVIVSLYAINGWDPLTKLFFQLTVEGGFGVLVLMVITSAATAAFFRRVVNRSYGIGIGRGVVAPIVSALLLGVVLVETLQQFQTLIGVPDDDPLRWIFPGSFAVLFLLGMIWTAWLRHAKPDVYRAIGTSRPPEPRPTGLTPEPIASGR
ncbi:APC family permease [Actinoplanes sp. NPDC020271]|uniref:APC family permease n=1 Tax=Actinoplanes sp. NPDC020271 TaxID=3363896 RepID=UPI00379C1501